MPAPRWQLLIYGESGGGCHHPSQFARRAL